MALKLLVIFGTFYYAGLSYTLVHAATPVEKNKAPFIAWEHYLQECGAEMPQKCSGSKKALNQACLLDSDCVEPATCQKSKCQCQKGHIPHKERCAKAPGLDEHCLDGQCAPPYVCSRRDMCECARTADRHDDACEPKCHGNQILIDGQCLPTVRLGGQCKVNQQCNAAFAYCDDNHKCHCVPGTRHVSGKCEANPICPDGTPPLKTQRDGSGYTKCNDQTCPTNQLPFIPPRIKTDTCPDGFYCIIPSHQDVEGFCCREKPYCPVGEPLVGKDCKNPRNEAERCPADTHHCYVAARNTYCCPLPCPSLGVRVSAVVDNGHCYEKRALREKCNVSAQCPRPAECINGTCDCPDGYKYQVGPFGEKCQKQCAAGKILVGSECLEMALPGAKCTHSVQCTAGTKCAAGACACPCGTIPYNGNCIDAPECPNFGNGAYDPIKTRQGTLVECSPNAFNFNSPPPCPPMTFCHRANIYSGGVCCPLPEPTCQAGRAPPLGRDNQPIICDFSGNSTTTVFCPRNLYCFDYTSIILPTLSYNAGRRGVCCPLDLRSMPGVFDGYPKPYKQVQWGQNAGTSGTQWPNAAGGQFGQMSGICPTNYRLVNVGVTGQIVRCPFYAYRDQCGQGGACFLHPSPNARFPGSEGVCCAWLGG